MKTNYIYKDMHNELFYVNNKGEEFLLAEAVAPLGRASYDLVVAIKKNPAFDSDPEYEFPYDTEEKATWFAGADGIKDYLIGKDNFLLESCKLFLDDKPVSDKIGKVETFYTGGGIWISAMYVDENRYIAVDSDCIGEDPEFCVYDHSKEDQDEEFPCQAQEKIKLSDEFTTEDWKNYCKLMSDLTEAHYRG